MMIVLVVEMWYPFQFRIMIDKLEGFSNDEYCEGVVRIREKGIPSSFTSIYIGMFIVEA